MKSPPISETQIDPITNKTIWDDGQYLNPGMLMRQVPVLNCPVNAQLPRTGRFFWGDNLWDYMLVAYQGTESPSSDQPGDINNPPYIGSEYKKLDKMRSDSILMIERNPNGNPSAGNSCYLSTNDGVYSYPTYAFPTYWGDANGTSYQHSGGCNVLFPGGDVQFLMRDAYQPQWKLRNYRIKFNMSDAGPHS